MFAQASETKPQRKTRVNKNLERILVFHLSQIGEMIRRIPAFLIVGDDLYCFDAERRGGQNPINAAAPVFAVKVMLGGRVLVRRMAGAPSIDQGAVFPDELPVNRGVRRFIK